LLRAEDGVYYPTVCVSSPNLGKVVVCLDRFDN